MKESHWIKRCGENIAKHLFIAVLCIGIIAISLTCMTRFGLFNQPGKRSINTSSLLTDAIDIAELSAAEFRYRGIADIYIQMRIKHKFVVVSVTTLSLKQALI